MYRCDTCKYACFVTEGEYMWKYVYCKKIHDVLKKEKYNKLKNCIFYEEKL